MKSLDDFIVKQGMNKCLDDGWFTLKNDEDYTDFYTIKNYDMVYRNITFEDLDNLEYNELYNKAKNKK